MADPVARAREIAARLAAVAIPGADALGKRKSRWEGDTDGGVRPALGLSDKKRKKVYIPVDNYPDINFMGLLIGPRGSNQKRMEDESGARILIRGKGSSKDPTGEPDENEELHVLITADSDEAVAKAQSAVEDILFNPQQALKLKQEQLRKVAELNGTYGETYGTQRFGDGDSHTGGANGSEKPPQYGPGNGSGAISVDMKVPRELVGYIIGRGGETIRDLQMKSGAHIQIVREEEGASTTPDRFVNITGNQDALDLAQRLIQNLIDERQQNQGAGGGFRERDDRDRMARYGGINPDGSDSVEILIPNGRVGLIIGRGGCTIKAIQQRTGTSITIPQTPDTNHPDMRLITIRGTLEAKEAARFEIQSMVNEEPGQRQSFGMASSQTIYMQVPNDRVGVIIGKRGETIKGIQDRHAVRIQIPQMPDPGANPPVRTISIQGPPQSLAAAKEEVDMVILQGAGTHGFCTGGGQYENYGGGYDQQQQYGSYGAQGQQDQYALYYQQQGQQGQYYEQDASSTGTTAAVATSGDQAATTTATADPNDPNAYWNGYYEYAAYYGVDAANVAWGVTGAAAQASAEAYEQYQQQAGVAAGAEAVSAAAPGTTSDAPAVASTLSDAPAVASTLSVAPAVAFTVNDAPAKASTVSDATAVAFTVSDAPAVAFTVSDASAVASTVSDAPAVASTLSDAPAVASTLSDAPAVASAVSDTPAVASTLSDAPAVTFTVSDAPAVASNVSDTPAVAFTVSDAPAVASAVSNTPAVAFTVSDAPAVASTVSDAPAVAFVSDAPTSSATVDGDSSSTSASAASQKEGPPGTA